MTFAPAAVLALALAPAAPPADTVPPQRWAVLVGVGDYQNFGDEVGGDLQGSGNDARAVRDVLTGRWGFAPDHVRLLLDADATRAGIEEALTGWAASRARPGDLVVFYFAGHGAQAWDEDGDEADGLDETMAPYDALRDSPDRDIPDDDLRAWLRPLSRATVVVILDSCHSGTATRAVHSLARPRSLNRPLAPPATRTRSVAHTAGEPPDPLGEHVLEIAAAQADQVAMDVAWPAGEGESPVWGGAFTTVLARHLWRAEPDASYADLFSAVVRDLRQEGFGQEPRLGGTALRDLAAFRPPAAPIPADAPHVRVEGVGPGGAIALTGGSLAGLTPGTLVRSGGATLRVERTEPARAVARLLAGPAPEGGAAVTLLAWRPPVPPLRIAALELPVAERPALAAAAAASGAVVLPDSATVAELVLRADGARRLLTSPDGTLRHDLPALTGADSREALAAALRRELAARRLGALENPAPLAPLELALASTADAVRVGESIEFRVRSGRDGYLTVVDLGPDGVATLLLPNPSDPQPRVRAGEWAVVPTPAMRRAGLSLEAAEPTGAGLVRAFVTERPITIRADAEWRVDPAAVAQALAAAAGRPTGGDAETLAVDSWITAAIPYRIRR